MAEFAVEHGALGLFLVAFLAATLLPVSSEVALAAALAAGVPVAEAIFAASVGNSLACVFNYALGAWAADRTEPRLQATRAGRAALRWGERGGTWALFLTWLPVIGDPLTLVAGLTRTGWVRFLAIVIPLRVGRYLALAGVLS